MPYSPNCCVAHIHWPKNAKRPKVQTLEEHLQAVARLTSCHAAKAGLPLAGQLVGLLHDFGKYSKEFQNYILSATDCIAPGEPGYTDPVANKGKINHAFAGGQHVWRSLQGNAPKRSIAQLLALCVISHHSGLKDCISPEGKDVFSESYMARGEEKTHHDQCARVNVLKAAGMLSCSRSWVYKLVEAGHLKAFRIGSRKGLQITLRSLEGYLARQAVVSD